MDIRNWSVDRIMQLPDCCFGRRWPIGLNVHTSAETCGWDISEQSLPEYLVIWDLVAWSPVIDSCMEYWRLALGDQLPTAAAMMNELEPVFNGVGQQGAGPRYIPPSHASYFRIPNLKQNVHVAGRRFVLEVTAGGVKDGILQMCIVVSSMPKEVPDWLVSGQGKNRL